MTQREDDLAENFEARNLGETLSKYGSNTFSKTPRQAWPYLALDLVHSNAQIEGEKSIHLIR